MELSFISDNQFPSKQGLCSTFLLFYCAVSCHFLQVDSVEVGGYCISYAQRECRNLSDPLYEGIFKPTPTTDICSLFDTYHQCIQGITLNCPITAAEKTFYDTSFVQFFNKEYKCHISTTGTFHQSDKNGGSVYKWNSLWSSWFLIGYIYLTNHLFTTFT